MLDAVIAFLRDSAIPALPPRAAFDARVAANALELVRREVSIGRAAEITERARLVALLGTEGDLRTLNAELAARLAEGRLDPASPAVARHLWATTLEKLAVDQPTYSAYRRSLAEPTQS